MSGTEDVIFRFNMADRLSRMHYGTTVQLDRYDVQRAWPPTGDHDHSMEAGLRAMALAAGGNRPETSYTTEERLIRDLDDSFIVEQMPDGNWRVHRRMCACPHCHGAGFVRQYPKPKPFDPSAEIDQMETVTIETVACEHRPVRR